MGTTIIRRAEEKDREAVAKVAGEAFYEDFCYFSKDVDVISRSLEHAVLLDRFFVAETDGEIVGITSYSDSASRSVYIERNELLRHYGLIKGMYAYFVLKKELHAPFVTKSDRANIEWVGILKKARGNRLAYKIVRTVIAETDYAEYQLDVKNNNTAAIKTYERIGFCEFARKKMSNPKVVGFDELIYMEYSKPMM